MHESNGLDGTFPFGKVLLCGAWRLWRLRFFLQWPEHGLLPIPTRLIIWRRQSISPIHNGAKEIFLETPDAHRLFFLVMGPVCQSVPLETAAWIGRVAGWGVLAIAVVHAARSVGLMSWGVILAGAMYSLAVRHTTVSGEWVIGGCEAKVFAWALVLWAVGDVARGKFSRMACRWSRHRVPRARWGLGHGRNYLWLDLYESF